MSAQVIQAAQTDQYCEVKVWQTSDGTAKTDLAHSTSGLVIKYQIGNAAVQSVSVGGSPAPASMSAGGSHTDWGFYHIDAGRYKIGLADAVVASAGRVSVWVTVTDCESTVCDIDVVGYDKTSVAVGANTTTPPTTAEIEAALVNEGDATALLQAIADKIAGDLTAGDLTALAIVSAIKADATLATMIGRIDADISSRSSHSAPTEPLDAAGTRSALGLSAADLDTQLSGIPAAVEAQMVNEGDATALLQAIADKIAGDLTAGDLTALAIVSAIKADATLATMISNIDTTISSRSSHSAPDLSNLDVAVSTRSSHSAPTEPLDAAGTRAAIGLSNADLDTQLAAQKDEICYALAVLAGTISNANGSTNTFQITRDGSTYTVTVSGVAETGNRTGQTLAKT